MDTQQQNIALSCDDSYISLLLTDYQNVENNQNLMSDEKYAEKLQLQEGIMASLTSHNVSRGIGISSVKTEPSGNYSREFRVWSIKIEPSEYISREIGESSGKNSREIGESSGKSSREIGESSKLHTCEICADTKNSNDIFRIQNCSHVYCNQCISRHVLIKIQKQTILNHVGGAIPCPGTDCKGLLETDACRKIVAGDVLAAWDRMLCESTISPSRRFYCPYGSCSGLLVMEEDEVVREAECPYCNRLFCARCRVTWHAGVGCDERGREDAMVHELAKTNKWQRCPSCMFFVERKEGCLHMTCRCGFEFCYACGKTWTYNHGGCQ